jgi:hypothetical protein
MDMGRITEILEKTLKDEPIEDKIKIQKIVLGVLNWEIAHLDQERPRFTEDFNRIIDSVVRK